MKKSLYLIIALCSISFTSLAQLPDANTSDKKTENTENFMDLQAKTYGDIFGNMMNIEELKGVEDFMSLVSKMDASPEMKKKLTEQYQLYSNSLDPEKKELVKAQFNTLLLQAIKEGQAKDNQND